MTDIDGDGVTDGWVSGDVGVNVSVNGGITSFSNASQTATISVNPVNDQPLTEDLTVQTNEDTTVNIVLSAIDVDGDELIYSILLFPSHGSISNFNVSNGTLTYIPSLNYNGSDSFTFEVEDALGITSNVGKCTLTVSPVNDPPVAKNQVVDNIQEDSIDNSIPFTFDPDPEQDDLTLVVVSSPLHGSLSVSGPVVVYQHGNWTTTLKYTPDSNFPYLPVGTGTDTFRYYLQLSLIHI